MKSEFLVISDLHLERKNCIEKNFILNVINNTIEKRKNENTTPILVCAGDLDNGIKGLDFLAKINCDVVYLCGNHEYWENDYNETKIELLKNSPSNVHFIDNDFVILEDFLFFGGTLWSDLAKNFNPDLFSQSKGVMADEVYITNKEWYKSIDNQEKVRSLYTFNSDKMIKNKSWNIFIEREENEKTVNYLNSFIEVFSILEKIPSIKEKLELNFKSKYEYSKITKEDYDREIELLFSFKEENISFKDWYLPLMKHFVFVDNNSTENNNIENLEIKNQIFKKLINIPNIIEKIPSLKLVGVSHHLPFLEERLIGRQEWFDEKINQNYFNDLPKSVYALRKGLDYNYHNYFYRISKGEFDKDTAITHAIHYSNDGSNNFSEQLIDKVYAWVHGHEHAYNYEDSLKGIKIITNPLSHSMAVFRFNESGEVSLNSHYKSYHKVSVEEEKEYISNLIESFLRVPNLSLGKMEMQEAVELWALKSFDWNKYIEEINYLIDCNTELISILFEDFKAIKNFKKEEQKCKLLIHSIDYTMDSILSMTSQLDEGVSLRNSASYDFMKKYADSLELRDVSSIFKPNNSVVKLINYLDINNEYLKGALEQYTFTNIVFLKESKKKALKLQSILKDYNIKRMTDIGTKELNSFNEKYRNNNTSYNRYEQMLSYNDVLKKFFKFKDKYDKNKVENNKTDFNF